jgi:hypothetical protein
MTSSPGTHDASWSPPLGNSPCTSLGATDRLEEGTVRVEAPATMASGEGPLGGDCMHARSCIASATVSSEG